MGRPRMFASLPFILLLILQGFARQDCAELLLGNQDLVNVPCQARSIRAFDDLIVQFSLSGNELTNKRIQQQSNDATDQQEFRTLTEAESRALQSGFLELQRSRDGPVA